MKPFRGFRSPNYTQVPDDLFDELLPDLSGGELKVLLYIIRRTFGFKRESDNISLSQMVNGLVTKEGRRLDSGVGLSKSGVAKALNLLISKNIIVQAHRRSEKHGDQPTNYRLNIESDPQRVRPTGGGNGTGGGLSRRKGGVSTPVDTGVHQSRQALSTPVDTQKTVDKIQVTFNVSPAPEDRVQQDSLVLQMLDTCGDPHSAKFYRRVAQVLPAELIFRAIADTKDQAAMGRIRKSPGACFTDTVTRLAREHGFDLGHGSPSV